LIPAKSKTDINALERNVQFLKRIIAEKLIIYGKRQEKKMKEFFEGFWYGWSSAMFGGFIAIIIFAILKFINF